MIYIHDGEKEVDRFDMPHCAVTQETQRWVRVYIAALAEDPSHRGYETAREAWGAEPGARRALERMFAGEEIHAVY